MSKKPKIAYLGIKGLPAKGGAERVVEGLVSYLNHDYDLYVYCSRFYSRDFVSKSAHLIKIRHLPGKYLHSSTLYLLSAIHVLFSGRYDLIHIHNSDAGFIVPLLRLRYRTVLGTCHGYPYKMAKWGKKAKLFLRISECLFIRFSFAVTCVSKTISNELRSKYGGKITFIPNGIEQIERLPSPARNHNYDYLPNKDFICFAAGRIDPTKGCHILLKALSKIKTETKCVIIGDFSQNPEYSKALFRMASQDQVTFLPFIEDRYELFEIIRKSKIFVFPSAAEAMSVMLLEVAAIGIPIICSDISENKDVLEEHAVYFKTDDSLDLAKKIDFVFANDAIHLDNAQKTKSWLLETYNWLTVSRSYASLYDSIIRK